MPKSNSREKYPIKPNYWYILDFRDFFNPKLMPTYFTTKERAKSVLKANVNNLQTRKRFNVLRGNKIIDKIQYRLRKDLFIRGGKYNYPKGMSMGEKKLHRTIMRRRLRRMNILTTVKAKFSVKHKGIKHVKYKPNSQKVSTSPLTDARVFKLDHKPKKYYYIFVKRLKSDKPRVIFDLKVYRVNIKSGEIEKMILHVKRNDIIFPYLKMEFLKIIKGKDYADRIKQIFYKLPATYKRKPKKVL